MVELAWLRMEDDSKVQTLVKGGLGALGLGAIGAAIGIPRVGIWIALVILVLALLLFGGYYLWHRRRARRQREQFTSAIEAQTAAAPRAISDPKKRADLDKVRGKFQTGLQEFKSRGKDIYKLPWYVIIGESGSGKTEAIRHSEIDFPPGLNKEHQGTGGTVNMDWWFTNRGVILDTAGSMVFPEAGAGETPEWQEFLRLLKKARPQCPVNGLFLVLSIESLIKDSADRISQKASRLAQHLDLIQRTLDVRFPVYLLVTKSDLLIGFREFFDSIEDPLLQHQMFGWSNPDPLDAPFRPDLVEQHLGSVAERLRRRRLALLRESSATGRLGDTQQFFASSDQPGRGPEGARRLDEVDSLFALPESLMRLAPRLRRYLETVFVAGEWSAKPVFLRGIYFTSSMREGKALDEAIAFATGLTLDQLPEDRLWDKNRAFFLRDLFHEKVFREIGLVTRATNTLALLRQRQVAIFGSAGLALLLLLTFAGFAHSHLKRSVSLEADYWKAGAANLKQGEWSPAIVSPGPLGVSRLVYLGTNHVEERHKWTLIQYHQGLKQVFQKPIATGLFKPMVWMGFGEVKYRREAQRLLFERSVVEPLVKQTRNKMQLDAPSPDNSDAVNQHREALLSLMQFEADGKANGSKGGPIAKTNATQKCEKYLRSFLTYLTGATNPPDPKLIEVFAWTYSTERWPPDSLRIPGGADHLSNNGPIQKGLDNFRKANRVVERGISNEVAAVNTLVDALESYEGAEINWLQGPNAWYPLPEILLRFKKSLDESWGAVSTATNYDRSPLASLAARYRNLRAAATLASAGAFTDMATELSGAEKTTGIFGEISRQIEEFNRQAGEVVNTSYEARSKRLDANYVAPLTNVFSPSYQLRWSLYTGACALASAPIKVDERVIGDGWKRFGELKGLADRFRSSLTAYNGPLSDKVTNVCQRIAGDAVKHLENQFVDNYVNYVTKSLHEQVRFPVLLNANPEQAMNLHELKVLKDFLARLSIDLKNPPEISGPLAPLKTSPDLYASVVSSLVNEDGTPVEWEVFFVPAEEGTADHTITKVFRAAQVSIGQAKPGWQELTRSSDPIPLAKGALDLGLTISFRKIERDPSSEVTPVKVTHWGLPWLIRDHKAERLGNGAWRFRVELKDPQQNLSGHAVFEARLDPKHLLPEVNVWPRQ